MPLVAKIQQGRKQPDTSVLHRQVSRGRAGAFRPRGGHGHRLRFHAWATRRDGPSVLLHAGATRLPHHDPLRRSSFSTRPFSASCTSRATGFTSRACPPQHYGLPLGEAVSLGIHESQSRLWENMVGRSRAFWTHFYPAAQQHFPAALGSMPLRCVLFRHQRRPPLVDPDRSRRSHLQSAHPHPLRVGAGHARRRSPGRRPAGRLE